MTTATKTPELTPEGWPIIRAEYRNDDPAELSLMDDCWHRGAYWRYTVNGLGICEEGEASYTARNSHIAAYDRVATKLKALGHEVAEVIRTGGVVPVRDYREIKTL